MMREERYAVLPHNLINTLARMHTGVSCSRERNVDKIELM